MEGDIRGSPSRRQQEHAQAPAAQGEVLSRIPGRHAPISGAPSRAISGTPAPPEYSVGVDLGPLSAGLTSNQSVGSILS